MYEDGMEQTLQSSLDDSSTFATKVYKCCIESIGIVFVRMCGKICRSK